MSSLLRVIFDPDTTPPTVPAIGGATALNETTIRVTWGISVDTGSGLAGYRIYRASTAGGAYTFLNSVSGASLSYDDQTVSGTQTWFYKVSAVDSANNESPLSTAASATTPDQTAPTRPGTPAGTALSSSSISWTWVPSTDSGGSGLQGYRVYLDGSTSPITTTALTAYTSTGHTANSTHTLRVIAFDGAGNATQSFLGSQTTAVGGIAVTWNPGYYALATSPNSHGTTTMDQARAAGFKGWEQVVYWSTIETARGVYNWTYVDQLLADCKANGLRLILQLWNNAFSGGPTAAIPAYMATELGGQTGVYASTSGGYATKLWDSRAMDRLLALFQAAATRYGSDPMFEGLRNGESSLPGAFDEQPDWSYANYKAQYLRLIAALPTFVPTTNAWVSLNYGFNPDDMPELCEAMEVNRCGKCGPDIYTGNVDHSTNGDRAFRGARWNGTAWVEGAGKDYRGRVPSLLDAQRLEMGGTEGSPSMAQLIAHDVSLNKSNHIGVSVKITASAPVRAAPDDIYWDNTVSPASADANKQPIDVLRFVPTAPSTVLTKPSVYPTVVTGAGPGQATTSVSGGVININSALGGSARHYIRWGRPTTNVGGSPLHDLKTFKIYIGTTPGGTQVVNGLDFSTTAQKIPTECRITGLVTGATYYVRLRAVDSAGNESSDGGEFSGGAAVFNPSRSFSSITGTTTISVAGDYQLTADFSGTVTINAANVYLYGNGHILSHTSTGIIVNGGFARPVIDGVRFNRTSGSSAHIHFNGTPGANAEVVNCPGMTVIGGARCITSSTGDLNGARLHSNTVVVQSITTLDSTQAFVASCINFLAYDNDITNASGAMNRSGAFGECGAAEIWSNRWRCAGSTYQAFFFSSFGTPTCFLHDNDIQVGGNADTVRTINFDGPNGAGATGAIVHKVLHNTFSYAAGATAAGPFIRVRNPVGPCDIGFNSFNMQSGSGNSAISYGSADSTGDPERPFGGFVYHNVAINYGSSKPLGFYGESNWADTMYSWNNFLGGQGDAGGGGASGNWTSNQDSFPNGVSKVGSTTWRAFGTTVTGTNPFTIVASWADYNPLTDVPSAPSTPVSVVGVA